MLLFALMTLYMINGCDGPHRVYQTTSSIGGDSRMFDCLFYMSARYDDKPHTSSSSNIDIDRYCRRLITTTKIKVETNPSLNKISVPFDQLREMNISAHQLLEWYAPIDVIEEYVLSKKMGLFFNCSKKGNLWFGPQCQYTFDSDRALTIEKMRQFYLKEETSDVLSITNGTCYLINNDECESVLCLDWREICDGKKTNRIFCFQ